MTTIKVENIMDDTICLGEAAMKQNDVNNSKEISLVSEDCNVASKVKEESAHNLDETPESDTTYCSSVPKVKVDVEEYMKYEQNMSMKNESDPLECLTKNPEFVNIKDETLMHLTVINNKNDNFLSMTRKEEQLDMKYHDEPVQEGNHSHYTDYLNAFIPLETTEEAPTKANLAKQTNSRSEKHFKCNFCFQEYLHLSRLNEHLRSHTGEKPYQCGSCSYNSSTLSNLRRHIKIHTGTKPYMCHVCSYECIESSSLKKHLRIHTGEKPYKCNFCSYNCSALSNLKVHVQIHTGTKPYKCNICSYESTQHSNLKSHLKVHAGEKPHKCNVCSYECLESSSLKRHIRIHTGEKPYKCNFCSFDCCTLSHLKVHLRVHTRKKS